MTSSTVGRRTSALAIIATLVTLGPLTAQAGTEAADAPELSGEVSAILDSIAEAGEKMLALAEATPEDKFSWAPTEEVRTISEIYMHVAGTNLLMPGALGAAPPAGLEMTESPFAMMAEWEKNVAAKPDVVAKLRESLQYVHDALASVDDLDTEVALFGPPAAKRKYFLILAAHAHEHLGQSIAYARSIGVTPPWSQPLPSGETEGSDS